MNHKLIYINKMGFNHKGMGTYEFIFCDEDDIENVWGDGWENLPAIGVAQPPDLHCISKVGIITCKDYELEVAHDSEYFRFADAIEGIFCLGYEIVDDLFSFSSRLVFHYGEDLDSVENKLKNRKLKLTYDNL